MTILTQQGIEFFERELLEECRKHIRAYELLANDEESHTLELGRIRLYEERARIRKHFESSERTLAGYMSVGINHGLLGRLKLQDTSSALYWKEKEGIRFNIITELEDDLKWKNNKPPKVHLTDRPKFIRKPSILTFNDNEN